MSRRGDRVSLAFVVSTYDSSGTRVDQMNSPTGDAFHSYELILA
jgi:hypothetical protein